MESYTNRRFKSNSSLLKVIIGMVYITIIAKFVSASQERL